MLLFAPAVVFLFLSCLGRIRFGFVRCYSLVFGNFCEVFCLWAVGTTSSSAVVLLRVPVVWVLCFPIFGRMRRFSTSSPVSIFLFPVWSRIFMFTKLFAWLQYISAQYSHSVPYLGHPISCSGRSLPLGPFSVLPVSFAVAQRR